MTSSSLTNLLVAATAFSIGAEPAKLESVTAVAKVDGVTKSEGNLTYQLMAVGHGLMLVSDSTGTIWSVVHDSDKQLTVWPGATSVLNGRSDPRVTLMWVCLPATGKLEFNCGNVALDEQLKKSGNTKRLNELGYKPFKVDVKDIPVVKGKTAEEVSKAVLTLPKPKAEEKK